jgi:transcription-repair coupling factor (superfamily II helicase)
MYLRLLNEVVAEKRGLSRQTPSECVIDIGVDAYIPEKYIKNSEQRIEIYKKIAVIFNDEQAMDARDELIDRFGEIPRSVLNLIDISLIRNLASIKKIKEINQKEQNILFHVETVDHEAMILLAQEYQGAFLFSAGKKTYFAVKNLKKENPIHFILKILNLYRS